MPDTVLVAEGARGRGSHHRVAAVAWCGAGRRRHVRAGRAVLCKMVRERPSDTVTGEQGCGRQREASQRKKKSFKLEGCIAGSRYSREVQCDQRKGRKEKQSERGTGAHTL